ncbi:MAG: helix-turn-helix transcriptional regulator [Eubacterium sp.]|nr:helix-turn-helix transcriptional regulator [Eubacterium sp.]
MRIRKKEVAVDSLTDKEIDLVTKVSDALAHPARLELYRYIMTENRRMNKVCTKDLVAAFDYAQATISQHMKVLVRSGLVDVKNEERFAYYYANLGVLMKYTDAVKKYSIV